MNKIGSSPIHDKKKQALLAKLMDIAQHVLLDPSQNEFDKHSGAPFSTYGVQGSKIFIPAQVIKALQKFYQEIIGTKKEWQGKYSEEYVEELLQPLIYELAKGSPHEIVSNVFNDIIHVLETYSEEQTILLPLEHIRIDAAINNIPFGSFTLCRASEDNFNQLQARLDGDPLRTMFSKVFSSLSNRAKTSFEFHYAQTQIVADPIKAIMEAETKFKIYLDLLRYAIDTVEGDSQKSSLNFLEGGSSYMPIVLSKTHLTTQQVGSFSLTTFTFTEERRQQMEQMGIFQFAGIVEKEKKTQFEKTLLRGIHWFADALVQTDSYNKAFAFVVSAEVFFATKGVDRIKQTVSEGIAFFLGKNAEERKALKNKFANLYETRNAVAHGEQSEVSDTTLKELKEIVKQFLAEMIRRAIDPTAPFKDKGDLTNWIEEQKFR